MADPVPTWADGAAGNTPVDAANLNEDSVAIRHLQAAAGFNVLAYGAVGDGTTDDTTAIQAAINAAQAVNGVVWFPVNNYLTGPLTITANVALRGAGWGSVLKLKAASNGYLLTFSPGTGFITVDAAALMLDGNAANQTSGGCIYAAGSVQSRFDNIHFTGAYDVCLWLYQNTASGFGHHNRVTRCLFDGLNTVSGANQQGIRCQSSDENYIAFNDFEGWGGLAAAPGSEPYAIKDWSGIQQIVSNVFVGGQEAVRIQDSSSTRVIGNTFDGQGRAGVHASGSKNVIQGNLFSDGSSASAGAYGQCEIDNSTSAVITGNSFTVVSTGKVRNCVRELSSGSSKTLVADNVIDISGSLYGSNTAVQLLGPRSKAIDNIGAVPSADGRPLNILDYGGVADGVTPNDTAWSNMLADMKTTGRPGYFPGNDLGIFSGSYAFTNPVDILGNGLVVFGDGPKTTAIRCLTNSAAVVRLGGEANQLSGMTLMHNEDNSSTTGDGLQLYKAFRCIITNLEIYRTMWAINVPAVDSSTVYAGSGGGNYAFSCVFESLRALRYWNGALQLQGYNAASTGSVIRNLYTNNEDGSGSTTTLSAAITAGTSTFQIPVQPILGQVVYIDTAGTVECRTVNAISGTGPYTITTADTFNNAHASGAAVTISNRYRANLNVIRVTQCDEMVFDQLNVEGVFCDGNVVQFQSTNATLNAVHFERVIGQGYQWGLIRVYGSDTYLKINSMNVAFCDFRAQSGDNDRALLSLGAGPSVDLHGLGFKGDKAETGITLHLVRITDTNTAGSVSLRGVNLGVNYSNDGNYSPQGTNLQSGAMFTSAAYTLGDNTQVPRVITINDRRYRWESANGQENVWGTAAPTSGSWNVGDTVWNTSPAAASPPGWVCTTAGSPGTWKAMASLAA